MQCDAEGSRFELIVESVQGVESPIPTEQHKYHIEICFRIQHLDQSHLNVLPYNVLP